MNGLTKYKKMAICSECGESEYNGPVCNNKRMVQRFGMPNAVACAQDGKEKRVWGRERGNYSFSGYGEASPSGLGMGK